MNDKKEDVICYCSGTTKETIKTLIDNGINDLDRISRETGACSGCGACDALILEIINHEAGLSIINTQPLRT